MEIILGIDLGTTNSAVAVVRDGQVQVLEEDGQKILPSVVGLDAEGQLLVGQPARNQWVLAPDRTIRSIKRKMGSGESVDLGRQKYTPQEISAMILRTLKERAARQLGGEVRKAVITVPAFFNEKQREATREAGELAGLEVVRIINEPTAAALTYRPGSEGIQRLLVYDLGGGTFDVSIVQIEQGVVEVLSSHGDTHLGGDDFDALLMDHVCERFQEEHGLDLRDSLAPKSRVLRAVEEAKRQLSFEAYAALQEEFIAEKKRLPLHLTTELARADYEALIEPLINKTLVCVDEALSDARLTASQIDRIVLVGGASRTPLAQRLLAEQLRKPLHAEVDPDLCVAMGAAIQGGLIAGLDLGPVLVDITPHTLGIQCRGNLFGFRSDFFFAPLIRRNTPLPAVRSEVFRTAYDGQEAAQIQIYQGENADIRHNEPIGEFRLEGLADVDAGNEVLVRFNLDLDGILKVTAMEKASGLEKAVTLENVVSRFRELDKDQAQARIDVAFGQAPQDTAKSASPEPPAASSFVAEDMPDELREPVARAAQLLQRSDRLAADAPPQDAEEMQRLATALREAVAARSRQEIEELCGRLDDLVFYLQDV